MRFTLLYSVFMSRMHNKTKIISIITESESNIPSGSSCPFYIFFFIFFVPFSSIINNAIHNFIWRKILSKLRLNSVTVMLIFISSSSSSILTWIRFCVLWLLFIYMQNKPMLSFSLSFMFKIVELLIFCWISFIIIIWVWVLDLYLMEFGILDMVECDMYAKWHVTNSLFFKFYSFKICLPIDRFKLMSFFEQLSLHA